MSRCPVDVYPATSLLQDTDGIPDVSGNGPVASVLPVEGDNTNCGLAVAEDFQETAWHSGEVLYNVF